ncbi:MAG: type IV toxin-antitoxin system AbiEi family antitoxin domain-containing protein [Prevotella sp.]|nr:type IV toxin-antitoxin system AbiEi family antitoxin domain-containing protein [Prevotella sp.]
MTGVSDNIIAYAESRPQFSVDDLISSVAKGMERNTLSWHLSNLCKLGKLRRIGRGLYSTQTKTAYSIKASKKVRSLYRSLHKDFPFADFCLYDGPLLTPLLHDLSPNSTIYIETNRDVMESVFNHLGQKYQGRLFLAPTKEITSKYIDLAQENIIIKPLITESPLTEDDGVPMPTLEKILVDTRVDADFFYLHGYENLEMLRTAIAHYDVNQTRLLRYADRRNEKENIIKDLKEIQ